MLMLLIGYYFSLPFSLYIFRSFPSLWYFKKFSSVGSKLFPLKLSLKLLLTSTGLVVLLGSLRKWSYSTHSIWFLNNKPCQVSGFPESHFVPSWHKPNWDHKLYHQAASPLALCIFSPAFVLHGNNSFNYGEPKQWLVYQMGLSFPCGQNSD